MKIQFEGPTCPDFAYLSKGFLADNPGAPLFQPLLPTEKAACNISVQVLPQAQPWFGHKQRGSLKN